MLHDACGCLSQVPISGIPRVLRDIYAGGLRDCQPFFHVSRCASRPQIYPSFVPSGFSLVLGDLPVAALSLVETASLTDLSPFITMSLRTITTSVAQGRGSQGGYRSAPGWSMCGAQRTYDKNHRDNQRIRRGGMNEPLRIVEISDYL